jgi:hypothetical protein
MNVRVTTLAAAELEAAADYLDAQSPGLGDKLYDDFRTALDLIRR